MMETRAQEQCSDQKEILNVPQDDQVLVKKIFSNDLIFEKIAENLSFRALMTIRATNSMFNKAVIGYRPLRDSALLVLNDNSMDKIEEFKSFGMNNMFPWKNISLRSELIYSLFPALENSLIQLFQNASSLSFDSYFSPSMKLNLSKLILMAQKLNSVSFEFDLLAHWEDNIGECFSEEVKSHFSFLSSISITGEKRNLTHARMNEYGETFMKNLKIVIDSTSQLKHFYSCIEAKISDQDALIFYRGNNYLPPSQTSLSLIHKVLGEKIEKIESVKVDGDLLLNKTAPIPQPQFLSLKDLDFTFRGKLMSHGVDFLKNHPLLTTLKLRVYSDTIIIKPLYDVLKRFGDSIEIFSLNLDYGDLDEDEAFEWSYDFLKNFKRLRSLTIKEHNKHFLSILPFIPEKISELSLSGFINNNGRDYHINDDELNYPIENSLTLLDSKKLTTLNLLRVKNSLNDACLHYIYENFTNLKSLMFSNCVGVTNYGITGTEENKPDKKSLRHLTKLGSLEITLCSKVSLNVLIENCAFIELRSITLSQEFPCANNMTTHEIARTLLENNPLLEKFIFFDGIKFANIIDGERFDEEVDEVSLNELKSINGHGIFRSFRIFFTGIRAVGRYILHSKTLI